MFSIIRSFFGRNSVKSKAKSRVTHRRAGSAPGLEALESRFVLSAVTENQVANLYRALLDRAPEAQALAAWSRSLESGRLSVGQMAGMILQSPEYGNRVVKESFSEYLGRAPGAGGLASYVSALGHGVSQERVDASILGSKEYFAKHGSGNIPFVESLYTKVLGRPADAAGLEGHVSELVRGASRSQVAYAILTSVESGAQSAGLAYWGLLGREGNPEELSEWSGVLTRSAGNPLGGQTAVFVGLAGSPEGFKSLSSASTVQNPIPTANGLIRALLPRLVQTSDTGTSNSDNVTSARTPTLTGEVEGLVSQVLIFIDGSPVDLVPVEKGVWKYTVQAEQALSAGSHTFRVQPQDGSGKMGSFSNLLRVTTVTAIPIAPTIVLAPISDSGAQGDGKTTDSIPTLRGVASPGLLVNVAIDGVPAGQVKADAKTGAWEFKAPRLANGLHDITATAENTAGLKSAATSLAVTVNGPRTVVLDGTDRNTVELTASHLFGQGSQGFIVTQVYRGTLQRWSATKNEWVNIERPAIEEGLVIPTDYKIAFNEVVRWTPSQRDVGIGPAFDVIPLDRKGGLTASLPEAGTVPGKILDPKINFTAGVGTAISWAAPTDGCGCASTRYSIEVTREDGKTILYSVPASVTQLSVPEGGRVLQAEMWGATKSGAGTKRSYDAVESQLNKNRLAFNVVSGLSALSVGEKARAQLAYSPTATQFTTSLPLGGSHANLAYLELSALPDATEAALGLPAGTPIMISSDSNKLTPAEKATLENNPILARNLFPGTVNGQVQPDQVRAHFQAGETLRFAGNVDKSVRAGARIVVEEAQILGDNSLGPWFEKASLAVAADGGYSYDHVVAYGMTSVRVRLEYPTTQSALSASAPASSTPTVVSTAIDLSAYFNAFGITTAPFQAPNNQGFDRNGNYYNSDYTGPGTKDPVPGTPIVYQGITFPIGNIPTKDGQVGGKGNSSNNNPPNFVQSKGQTITVAPNLVAADASDYLYLAGAAANGNQLSQTITLKFADGSADETWTQSFHDWASVNGPPQSAPRTYGSVQPKLPVRVATTAGLEATSGLQTIDGVALAAGDRVLVKNQGVWAVGQVPVGIPEQNGIYVASAGVWSRALDAENSQELTSAATSVESGATNGGKYFVETGDGAIIQDGQPWPGDIVEETPPVESPRTFAGELLLKTEPERINPLGNLVTTPAHLFAYCYNLHGKQLASITLPPNENVGILSAVVANAPVIAIDQGIASLVLGTTNLTGVDVMALTIVNESNIGDGGGPLTFYFADQPMKGSTTSVALSSIATTGGIIKDGTPFTSGGFDGDGNAYSWEALGSSKTLRGTSVNFKLGLPGQPNFVVANGQTIQVPQGSSYTTLNLAGAAINGGQQNQPLTLTFTDNSTAVWTQSFSDWTNPANYTNESTIATAPYIDTASGGHNQTTNHIYQYSYTIPSGKQLASITLPTNSNVRLLDIQITPPTYTTKQVTVPMGQQTTIAYIAPDSTSQMTFYVQKAGTCVGNCTTYLTDWTTGAGQSTVTESSTLQTYASAISPSLNSQIKAGQSWTMTIQNAIEGYYGYLDSPSGKNLPGPAQGLPGGARFSLQTEFEINYQPKWAVAVEKQVIETIVMVGLAITTAGVGDLLLGGEELADGLQIIDDSAADGLAPGEKFAAEYNVTGGPNVIENIEVDGVNQIAVDNIPDNNSFAELDNLHPPSGILEMDDGVDNDWRKYATHGGWLASQ